jgi:hypothetical protein
LKKLLLLLAIVCLVVALSATANAQATKAACRDGWDNDADAKIDYPADPGCTRKQDRDETDHPPPGDPPPGDPPPGDPPPGDPPPGDPPPGDPPPGGGSNWVTGIYEGWHDVAGVDAFYSWLGAGYTGEKWAHEFVDHNFGWGAVGNCLDSGWSNWVNADNAGRRFSLSLPLLPTSNPGDFAGLAAGSYDAYFTQCATALKNGGGTADTVIRLGWEMNGNTFPWAIPPNNPTALSNYKAGFSRIVNAMRAANPSLKIEWEPNAMLDYSGYTLEQMYPGDDVVDYIGATAYDYCNERCTSNTPDGRWQAWVGNGTNDNGLQHSYTFATSRGKKINQTEWGLWPASRSPGGGGDNPQYIINMANWLRDHGAAYQIYNNVADWHLDNYPQAKAEFQRQFGAS